MSLCRPIPLADYITSIAIDFFSITNVLTLSMAATPHSPPPRRALPPQPPHGGCGGFYGLHASLCSDTHQNHPALISTLRYYATTYQTRRWPVDQNTDVGVPAGMERQISARAHSVSPYPCHQLAEVRRVTVAPVEPSGRMSMIARIRNARPLFRPSVSKLS